MTALSEKGAAQAPLPSAGVAQSCKAQVLFRVSLNCYHGNVKLYNMSVGTTKIDQLSILHDAIQLTMPLLSSEGLDMAASPTA